jgi:hypothetical protein
MILIPMGLDLREIPSPLGMWVWVRAETWIRLPMGNIHTQLTNFSLVKYLVSYNQKSTSFFDARDGIVKLFPEFNLLQLLSWMLYRVFRYHTTPFWNSLLMEAIGYWDTPALWHFWHFRSMSHWHVDQPGRGRAYMSVRWSTSS